MNCGHTEDNRLENDGCATCHLHDGITWRDAEIQKLEARIERQRKANAAMHRQMDRKSALEVQVYKLEQAMVDIHASLLAGTAEACDEAERIAAKMTGAEFLTNVEEPAPRPSVSVPEVPYRPCTIHGGYDPSLKQCPGCLDAKLVDAPRPSDAQAREWCPKCKEPMANWGPDWPHKCPRTDAEKAMSLQFAADAAAMPRTKEAVASLEKATKAMLDNAGVTIEHGPRTNEAQSGPLCPGCGWPRTPQQSHAESCPVARGDGARCHRCGHYETSYERAASLYAHCPSCSRHTRWERVPNDPRTDSAKAWPEMPAWADDTDDDKPLPEDAEIKAAFPTRSERHDLYGEAMRLVGARRSKGGLVALVTWLLLRAEHQRTASALTSCSRSSWPATRSRRLLRT